MTPPRIERLQFGRNKSPLGIGQARPTLQWRYAQDEDTSRDYVQRAYQLRFGRNGTHRVYHLESESSIDVPWPEGEASLASRERVTVGVRAHGKEGEWTNWLEETVEAALLNGSDWTAQMITTTIEHPVHLPKRPYHVRTLFTLSDEDYRKLAPETLRIYATALGVYQLELNGQRVGDHVLSPGWQSYQHRLHYQTFAVPGDLLSPGQNVLGAIVGEGWYAGRITWTENLRNYWGTTIGVQIQLELPGRTIATSDHWQWSYGPILSSELYDGETYDVTLVDNRWSLPDSTSTWNAVKTFNLSKNVTLIAPEAPPIRRTDTIAPASVLQSATGKAILDFGQNLVGWVKIKCVPVRPARTFVATLRYAEVLDEEEIATKPLRSARATDTIILGSNELYDWEPTFTLHGFRYVEVSGIQADIHNFCAVVTHTDMSRVGHFECSHPLLNKLHANVVWSMRGNFVGVPTDCPQRDERLGYTGDLQAFAPTASFLYDTSGFLANWFHDLSIEQLHNFNVPPLVIPNTHRYSEDPRPFPQAVWFKGDVCSLTPAVLFDSYGSLQILEDTYDGLRAWLDKGVPRAKTGLWLNPFGGFQLGDWLDPRAPVDNPADAMTDPYLVADAYLLGSTAAAVRIAGILGKDNDHERYQTQLETLRKAFHNEYVTPSGRLSSESQTGYALVILFDILRGEQRAYASERLVRIITRNEYKIGTGFAGTPHILNVLAACDQVQVAYRMLQETRCPSWLYPVTMGATTIWERWDSLMTSGKINPSGMTSFNHYASGSVADFLHKTVAGLSPLAPGWKRIRIWPRPGGTVLSCNASHVTPYGRVSCQWALDGGNMSVAIEVPPNTSAEVTMGSVEKKVGSGRYSWTVAYEPKPWPPPLFRSTDGKAVYTHGTEIG